MKIQPRASQALRAGFSLAELMVVIVIIGLLATLVVPNVIQKLLVANVAVAEADIMTIDGACTNYAIANQGRWPDSLNELVQKDDMGFAFLDLENVPQDPWKNEFLYDPPTSGQSKGTITCLGSDGAVGGEGDARDFTNHMIRNKQ
jgi:general secretion pathway protein G